MKIITISRQYGSGGNELARLICDRLGYRYFDKDLMAQLAAELGVAPETVVDLSEAQHRAPGFLERLASALTLPFNEPTELELKGKAQAAEQMAFQRFQSLIDAAYEHGQVVVVGRGGQVVLHGKPDVLHVRVVAPLEQRIQRTQALHGLKIEEAGEFVAQRDQAAADYVQRYYGVDAASPLLYDLVINTEKLTLRRRPISSSRR